MAVLSAGVIVVRKEQDWHFLLLRAYQYWDFPKGMVEKGEDPLQGACREVEEETTICDLSFHWGQEFRETPPYGSKQKIARYYLGQTQQKDIILPITEELGRPEHDEYRWCLQADCEHLLSERVKPIFQWAISLLQTPP